MSTTPPQTRHTVTAIIVAHDGARLLPGLVKAVRAQTYPVERTVGVDTGSRDRSGAVLAELIGQDAVFGMDRSTGYGEAVAVALRHSAARRPVRTDQGLKRVEWIWLLHDDCEPAPETLERLLRAASRDRSVVVLGPKVLDGQDRRVLREAGVSIDRAGRRITGIEPGEIDQGQHDHNRAVLAVSSAGMLIRRDAWERLGGFDTQLKLFRDDLDFCWRAQGAGYRVQVVTDAVLYHRELSARRRRTADTSHPRRLDRRNALYVLAVNLPLLTMLRVLTGCVAGSLVRAGYFLLAKQVDLAAAQLYGVAGLAGHPLRLWQGRRRRAAGRSEGYSAVRMFIVPGRTLSRLAESIAGLISSGPPQASGGQHRAAAEEAEDEQFVDAQSVVRRIIAHPGVQLVVVLLVVALVAERRLLGTSPLGGGALVPAWGGAAGEWREYLAGFHAVGVGSAASAPPYLAVMAALGTVLGGQAWLAVDVLLLGCVPLAGLTAYLATRRLAAATATRLWLAASYALLPVATGAIAAGRLGTAVGFAVLPLIGMSAGRMLTAPPRAARRAAWATGLLVALAAAFAPLIWVFGVVFAVAAVAARRWLWADPVNAAIVAVTPFIVLFPWSLHLVTSPSAFLTEAGLQSPGLSTAGLRASALLLLSPGGPGLPPAWITAGLALALLAALLPHGRTMLTAAGWCVAAAGLLGAVVVSRTTIMPVGGGKPVTGWPGAALAVAALGLLLAAAPAAQWLTGIAFRGSGAESGAGPGSAGPRRLLAGITLAAAASAPVLAAGFWVTGGVRGPVGSVSGPVLPAFVSASSTSAAQYRTLILRPDGDAVDYSVVRQRDPILGEPELTAYGPAEQALSRQVAALGAPDGADAGDPGLLLGEFGIKWVLLPGPVDQALAQRLNAAVGLVPLSSAPAYDLWQVAGPVARLQLIAADGTVTSLASQPGGASGITAPASGGTLVLAEPYGGWTATLSGTALKPLAAPVHGWAQGFVLPAGGGRVVISRNDLDRALTLIAELVAFLAVCVLALPGKRTDPAADAEALAAVRAAQRGRSAARRSGRSGSRGRSGQARRRALQAAKAGPAGRAAQRLGALRGRPAAGKTGAEEAGPGTAGVGVLTDADEPDEHWDTDPRRGQPARREQAGGWDGDDQLDDSDQWDDGDQPDGGQWDDGGAWGDDDQWGDTDHWNEPNRLTGPRPAAPRQTGPRPAPWETGRRPAARNTGPRPAAPWETGPRETGPRETGSRDTGPRVPPRPPAGPQPAEPWHTGPQPAAWQTGPRPAAPRGTGPHETPPWDTGDREQPGDWNEASGRGGSSGRDAAPDRDRTPGWAGEWGSARGRTEPDEWTDARRRDDGKQWESTGGTPEWDDAQEREGTGERGAPRRAESARREEPPERHSHRAGRHGRPGRRRGPGDRSGTDGRP